EGPVLDPEGRMRGVAANLGIGHDYLQNHVIGILLWHRGPANEPLRRFSFSSRAGPSRSNPPRPVPRSRGLRARDDPPVAQRLDLRGSRQSGAQARRLLLGPDRPRTGHHDPGERFAGARVAESLLAQGHAAGECATRAVSGWVAALPLSWLDLSARWLVALRP